MKKTAILLLAYALLLLLGGCIGFFVAGSIASLVASGLSFTLLSIGIYALFTNNFWGYPFSIVVVGLLAVFFLYRFFKSWAIMPSGMMALLSIAFFFFLIVKMITILRKTRAKQA